MLSHEFCNQLTPEGSYEQDSHSRSPYLSTAIQVCISATDS